MKKFDTRARLYRKFGLTLEETNNTRANKSANIFSLASYNYARIKSHETKCSFSNRYWFLSVDT